MRAAFERRLLLGHTSRLLNTRRPTPTISRGNSAASRELPPHYPKTDDDGKPVTSDTPKKLTDAKDGVDENVRV